MWSGHWQEDCMYGQENVMFIAGITAADINNIFQKYNSCRIHDSSECVVPPQLCMVLASGDITRKAHSSFLLKG